MRQVSRQALKRASRVARLWKFGTKHFEAGFERGRPGAMTIGAKQSIYIIIYISQGRGPFLVLKRQEKADTQTWASLVFDQNGVPKPGAQNRQFCGDAWAYPQSIYIYTHKYN